MVPTPAPVTMPVAALTVAMDVLALVHVPPEGELDNVVLLPTQVLAVPEMIAGNGFTVATVERKQPVANT